MKPASRLRWLALVLILSAAILSGIYWCRLYLGNEKLRTDTIEQASQRVSQLAKLQAHHMEALLLALDLSLQQFRDALQAGNQPGAELIARNILAVFPKDAIVHLSRIDVRGYFEYSTVHLAKPIYVGDRDYFGFHGRNKGKDHLFINKPIFSRSAGKWVTLVTRPIFKQNRFDGAAFISLSPEYFSSMLAKLGMGSNDVSSLLYSDGAYMARSQGIHEVFGKSVRPDRPFLSPESPVAGIYRSISSHDNVERIYAWHKVEGYSLVAVIGLEEKTVLAPVEQAIDLSYKQSAIATTLLLALIAAISYLLMRASRQQKALENSRAMLRSTLESTQDGILVVDSNGAVVDANYRFYELLRIPDELAVLGRGEGGDAQIISQRADHDGALHEINELYRTDEEHSSILNFKDGRVFDRYTRTFYQDQRRVRVWSFRDITASKRSEIALLESEAKYREVVETTDELITRVNTEGRLTFVNHMSSLYFGLPPEQCTGLPAFSFVHPDDLQTTQDAFAHWLSTDKLSLNFENRQLSRSGNISRMQWSIIPDRDPQGKIIGFSGFARDVTERKQAENKLQLAANVFTHAREGIMITDPDGTLIEVNDTFTHITGYSRDAVLGLNPKILKSGHHAPGFYFDMWRAIIENGYWSGEIWNRHKDGNLYAELLTISVVRDDAGKTQNYVGLFTDITEMKRHEEQLQYIAHYDALTGLPNRVLFADRLQQAMALSVLSGEALAVAYLDLDGFKAANDVYGHHIGDELLVAVSQRMQTVLRGVDTLSRIGGDEFVIVLTGLEHANSCDQVLARLLKAVSDPVSLGDIVIQVSASIGVTLYPQDGADADQLLRHADQAMYLAKQAGKNRYHFFDVGEAAALRTQRESLERIRQALDQHEFVLHYQPKVNLKTGKMVGAEALIRWQHPERGLLLPTQFLPVIENHPISDELGEWVIDTALAQIAQWRTARLDTVVSVNLGAHQLECNDFIQRLTALLAGHPDVQPHCLELEILETSTLGDMTQVFHTMQACRKIGVRFALDDFGTGYSSLTYLKNLPVDVLKIDHSFVRDMLDDTDDLSIVKGVIGLAAAFHRVVVAEGVETMAHAEMLLSLGCELAQGHGIAYPMPAAELPGWARNWQPEPADLYN